MKIPDIWKEKIIPHPVQNALVSDKIRFKVVPAGRRSGKTWRAKRYLIRQAMRVSGRYFFGAPTYAQAKEIFWADTKAYVPEWLKSKTHETTLTLYLKNKSEIHVVGLDKPERVEGQPWTGAIVDEMGNCKPDIWDAHLSPLFDTIGIKTWCWFIGVPEGLNHYNDLNDYALHSGDPEWKSYTWFSSDILPVAFKVR